jgi:uncharacterized protein (DUF2062 family)
MSLSWLRAKVGDLFHLQATPRAIATGIAAGIFFGFTPLWGLKTLLALLTTRLLRGSLIAAAIATTLHDVFLPLMPFLLRWEYDLGYLLLSHPHHLPAHLHLHHQHPLAWFHWSTFLTVGLPLLLGSVCVALPSAVAAYYLSRALIGRHRAAGAGGSGVVPTARS